MPGATPGSVLRSRPFALGALLVAGAALTVAAAFFGARDGGEPSRCAPGLVALGPRCCGEGQHLDAGRCAGAPARCAAAHVVTPDGCAPRDPAERVAIAAGHLHIGPGDWEAQGVVEPRDVDVAPFDLDVFEVTEARWRACAAAGACPAIALTGEPGRPVGGVTFPEAQAFCTFAGGRLPTRDELVVAISGAGARRYPWGDTGAVCRRGAWGLATGPCASGAEGPDLVGAHPDGRSREGAYDLAGNVAEWVTSSDAREGHADVLGGSFRDTEAAALRGWNRRAVPITARDAAIGIRCVYPRR
ncbi:MAG: SUMF1/EgtB/PvdO family nonheme iron enzyme [Polyangiaceae bacterium]